MRKGYVVLRAIIMVLTIVMVMPTLSTKSEAVSKNYVKSLKVKSKVTVKKGKKVTVKPVIKVKGKTSKVLTVKSKNKKIAKVSYSKKKNTITIKGVKPGKTTITVTTKAKNKKGKKITKKIKVTVKDVSQNSQEKSDGISTVSGKLKTKSGTLIKEDINISFVKKADYEAGDYSSILSTFNKNTGQYSIDLSAGEYVALIEPITHNGVLYVSKNEKLGELTIGEKDKSFDLVYDGYYISGTWLRNNNPMDEVVYVKATFSNGSGGYTNTVTAIQVDKRGHFYFLCDSYYSEYDAENDMYGFDVEKLSFNTDSYNLMSVKPYTQDMIGVTWKNDYYVVKGTVTNHGSNQIYGLYYWGLGYYSTYLCSYSITNGEYDRDANASFDFTNTPNNGEDGDYEFIMGVPAGKYKLKIGTALSTNEIIVNKDMQDCMFKFDAYKVTFDAEYTGEAGDSIDEDPTMYIYKDGEEVCRVLYEYIDYEPIYLSPGTYDIRLRQRDSSYPKKVTEFMITDSDMKVKFSY